MKIHFCGANRTTTGSRHLLEVNGRRVLMECGMYQGRREESLIRNHEFPFDATRVDALLLSHAHIDHSGVIPVFCKAGFRGPIFCTDATADLCRIMLMDSAHIQEQDAAFVSKKNAKKGLPPVPPLYTQAETSEALKQLEPVAYNRPVPILDGLTATWLDAGHILGSAMIVLDIEEAGTKMRLAFSGDLGRGRNDILRDPDHPRDVDVLLTESTYGNREHEPLADVNDKVCAIINRAIEQNGKVVIPSFAVGRTQQLLYTLHLLMETRCLPELPIYVDSPLSLQATEVFRRHPECFNKGFYDVMHGPHNPFSTAHVTYIQSVEESMALNDVRQPCIIISASGMAEAGRIRHHLRNNIEDPRNTILIVGWCAPHTLGSHLASGHKEVNIFGEPYKVKARVETINAFSGHADKNELRQWVCEMTGPVNNIFIVHGEEQAALTFADTLRADRPHAKVAVPEFGSSVEL